MNQERFDELAQAFATNSISRRQVLKTLAASLLLGMLPTFGGGRHAAAQTVCTEVGSSCTTDSECCSDICGRRGRCKCKNLGQSCSETRNCCSGICQNGQCVCLQPGFGCADDEECCSGNCCGGFCCAPNEGCRMGNCFCNEELYEPCGGLYCCHPLTQECQNGTCCSKEGVRCRGDSQCCSDICSRGRCKCKGQGKSCSEDRNCCSGACENGRCSGRCVDFGDCDADEECCQGNCVPCPSNGQCFDDGTCGCPGFWCPPSENFPNGSCCVADVCTGGCCPTQGPVGACICCNVGTACDPQRDCGGYGPATPAKPWPEQ